MLKNDKYNIGLIAKKNNFKRFIYYRLDLRDKIKYDIELIEDYLNVFDNENNTKTKVIFACQTVFQKGQKIPPKFSNNFVVYDFKLDTYKYETTTIDILINCSDSEFKKTTDYMRNSDIQIEYILYRALQYFAYKYDLAVSGNDFVEPIELCTGKFRCSCYYRNKKDGEYQHEYTIIYPKVSLINSINNNNNLNFQNIVNSDIPIWKYFINKTIYYYKIHNNLECVLNAAISIEAYIIYLIKENNKYKEYLNTCKYELGFKSSLKFIKNNAIVSNNICELIEEEYLKIGVQRNLIIHGVIDSPFIKNIYAQKAYEAVVDVFSAIDNDFLQQNNLLIPNKYFEDDYNIMNKVISCYNKHDYQGAVEILSNNINNDLFYDLSIFNRGKCYIELNEPLLAIDDFNLCINNRYRLIESYNYLGMQLSKINRHEEAKYVYMEAVNLDNSYPELYYNLGIEQQLLKEYDDSIDSYNKALRIKKCGCYYYNLGTVYYYKKDYKKALFCYNEAIKIDPNNSKYLYERAFLYEVLKKPVKSERDIKKCIKYYKGNPHITLVRERLFQIGVLYQKEKKYKDAIRMFTKGIKIDNKNYVFYQARGNCYKSLGILQKAQKDYNEYLKLSSNT